MSQASRHRARGGFTLIEVLASVVLTAIVMAVAVSIYIDFSDQAGRAEERVRQSLHRSAVLDRIARDMQGATLQKKPDSVDPLYHPWIFVADSDYAPAGSDRVKFISRSQIAQGSEGGNGGLVTIAYFLRPDEDAEGAFDLYRWSSPGLPAGGDREFPTAEDERSLLLGEGVALFQMRFLSAEGEWAESWDSTQLVESSELPASVEIEVALRSEDEDESDTFGQALFSGGGDLESEKTMRRVILPVQPIDIAEMIAKRNEAEASRNNDTSGLLAGEAGDSDFNPDDFSLDDLPPSCAGGMNPACEAQLRGQLGDSVVDEALQRLPMP